MGSYDCLLVVFLIAEIFNTIPSRKFLDIVDHPPYQVKVALHLIFSFVEAGLRLGIEARPGSVLLSLLFPLPIVVVPAYARYRAASSGTRTTKQTGRAQ